MPCFLQPNAHARRRQLLGVVIGARIVDERGHHRGEFRLVKLIPRPLIHRHRDHEVAFAEDAAQALTRIGDLVPGQKAKALEHRAHAVELSGHGTRLRIDRGAKTIDLARQAGPLGARPCVLLAMRAAVNRMLTHRDAQRGHRVIGLCGICRNLIEPLGCPGAQFSGDARAFLRAP